MMEPHENDDTDDEDPKKKTRITNNEYRIEEAHSLARVGPDIPAKASGTKPMEGSIAAPLRPPPLSPNFNVAMLRVLRPSGPPLPRTWGGGGGDKTLSTLN